MYVDEKGIHIMMRAMRAGSVIWAVFLLCSITGASPAFAQSRELPDFTDLVEKQAPTVVNISTTQSVRRDAPQVVPQLDENDPFYEFFRRFGQRPGTPGPREFETRSLGSGFIISADGYILTNSHVVDNADEITVRLTDKREFKAKVIGADRRTDVALIKIEAANLPVVRIGDPVKLRVGEWVLAIGSPFGFDSSVTAGIVSAKGRNLPSENFVPFIQTDVAINPGNSGGPLFNMRGEVVGINSQIYSRTGGYMGLSFAIPIDVVMDVQNQLRQSGRVSRGRIGVVIQEVTRELADSFGLAKAAGALVNSVEKGGPADKAGVQPGDIILKFDGKPVASSTELQRFVGATRPGTRSAVEVWRKGAGVEVHVTVAELPEDRVTARERSRPRPIEKTPNRLGLVVGDLGPDQRRDPSASGVVVEEVRGQPRGDVRAGDIITSVTTKGQTTEVKSADQFNKLLTGLDKGATLTLQVRRADTNLFVTVRIEDGK